MSTLRRHNRITVRLDEFEKDWLQRKAHWERTTESEVLRDLLRGLMADEGYLRPSDDEAQDFGYEKEMMQYVLGISRDKV